MLPSTGHFTPSVSRVCGFGGQGDHALHQAWRARKHLWRVNNLSPILNTTLTLRVIHRNSLGCAIATTALDILIDEGLCERAQRLGEQFRSGIRKLNSPLVKEVRGRGLLNAIVIDESKSTRGRTAWQLCLLLKSLGVLAKPTHVNVYGLICQPPLERFR
jgi:4-aminobutyrate aminotransferase-like enzyme